MSTIQHFSEWLKELAKRVSFMTLASTLATSTQQPHSSQSTSRSHQQPTNRQDRALHTANSSRQKCVIWGDFNHPLEQCNRFLQMRVAERWDSLRLNGVCFCCLRSGNAMQPICRNRKRCDFRGYFRLHYPLLHSFETRRNTTVHSSTNNNNSTTNQEQRFNNKRRPPPVANSSSSHQENAVDNHNGSNFAGPSCNRANNCLGYLNETRIMFRIIPVKLFGNNVVIKTYAYLDEGSSVTMIDDSLENKLGLHGPLCSMTLNLWASLIWQ